MKFLIDNALSPVLASLLKETGYDAVHVRTVGLQHANDDLIFDHAAADDRIVVSADTDFSNIAGRAINPEAIRYSVSRPRQPQARSARDVTSCQPPSVC